MVLDFYTTRADRRSASFISRILLHVTSVSLFRRGAEHALVGARQRVHLCNRAHAAVQTSVSLRSMGGVPMRRTEPSEVRPTQCGRFPPSDPEAVTAVAAAVDCSCCTV